MKLINQIKIKLFWGSYRVQILSGIADYILSNAYFLKDGYKWVDDDVNIPFSETTRKILTKSHEETNYSIEHYIKLVCSELSQKSEIPENVFLKLCKHKFNKKPFTIYNFFHYYKLKVSEKKLMEKVASSLRLTLEDFLPDENIYITRILESFRTKRLAGENNAN